MKHGNIYSGVPQTLPDELVEILSEGTGHVRIERIVSRQHASPPDFWYDQNSTEWVTLLKGSAVLRFEREDKPRELKPGDWIEIPPGEKHRVESSSGLEDTVWLAVHFA